jgi:NADH-quinone oxidoreductase subunit H
VILLLQRIYEYQDAQTMWEALRAWFNSQPFPGWRFTPAASHALMLVSALIFIFLFELLMTIGLQVWERRVLGRMQGRWGPQVLGDINSRTFKRVLLPIVVLLAIPPLVYGLEFGANNHPQFDLWRTLWLCLAISSTAFLYTCIEHWNEYSQATTLALKQAWQKAIERNKFQRAVWNIASLLVQPLISAARVFIRHRLVHSAIFALGALALLGAGVLNLLPPLNFGRFTGWITVFCTFTAFGIYLIYVFGWLWRQGFADALKLFTKQDIIPLNADRFLFMLAPFLVYLPSLLSWVVLPFGVAILNGHYIYYVLANINVGLLIIIADFSFFLVAVIIAGYGSNNKFALVGAMREAAELLTYEVPMLMSLLCVALFAGSLNLLDIVNIQDSTWAILPLFPAFVIFFITAIAETNRPPFDLPEASNELLGGFVVEYSGLRFALFYVAEYANVFLACAEMTVCFLGGWRGPWFLGPDGVWLSSIFWFMLKTFALMFCFIWVRATMPRIRIDQVMFFSWKFLVPASILTLAVTAIGVVMRHPWFSANRLWKGDTGVNPLTGLPMGKFQWLTTHNALQTMTLSERAFFWTYNAVLLAIAAFFVVLAWRIIRIRRKHPLPRREVTWT